MDHTAEFHEEMKNSRWLPSAPEQFLFHYKGEPSRVFSAEFKMGLKYVIHKVPGDGAFYGHQTELNVNTWVDSGEWVVVASGNHFDEPDVEKLQDIITDLELKLQANEWVSVGDRLPKERCLAYTPNDSDLSMQRRIIPAGMFKQIATDATHWMPLPSPPGAD